MRTVAAVVAVIAISNVAAVGVSIGVCGHGERCFFKKEVPLFNL